MLPFYGGRGDGPARLAHVFVSASCLEDPGAARRLPPGRRYSPISGSRGLTCASMLRNTATPRVEVPPEPRPVAVDGREVPLHHAHELPLTTTHHLA
jgi:urease subunit alpha